MPKRGAAAPHHCFQGRVRPGKGSSEVLCRDQYAPQHSRDGVAVGDESHQTSPRFSNGAIGHISRYVANSRCKVEV